MNFYNVPIPDKKMPNWIDLKEIDIEDLNEELVPTSLSKKIMSYPIYYKMGIANAIPECFVRKSVLDKLIEASLLLPDDIYLVILDGWRPFYVQEYLYNTLLNKLRKLSIHENKTVEEIEYLVREVVSPPSNNPKCPSPHQTGGAVDVTLCDIDGHFLDMGTHFDENSPLSWSCALENQPDSSQAKNRRLLYNIMTKVGFTNLSSEWWHYDYGNQLWAKYLNKKVAIYGATVPITVESVWS